MRINKVSPQEIKVINILSELSEKQRVILVMRFLSNKTQEEVGDFFKITKEGVRDHENKGLKIIRENINGKP
ncbi:MAG: DNA directed RNA polymerase subunit [Siphoviridae sp. cttb18]|nr:MAG: DNA directed RNA polymerase subunit [Siphoviridae sp. cttb18]